MVEINFETLEISNITPLDIEFQGVIDCNFLLDDNIVIPGDNELVIFNLDSNKLKQRYLAMDRTNNILDYFCGITFCKDYILTKSMAGFLTIYNSDNFNSKIVSKADEAPILCDNSIMITDNFILNSNYSNIELIDINTKEKRKIIREKKISPFVQNGNIVLYINSENELCKIDLTEI